MNEKSNELKFERSLNKTIVLASKLYYKQEIAKNFNELKIIDDEKYSNYLNNYLKDETELYNINNMSNFIELCNNTRLVSALKSLSDIEMTVIFLLFEQQFTSKEASKILKVCSDSITRIKRRALKKLKKHMKGGNE